MDINSDLDKITRIVSHEIGKSVAILKNEKPDVLVRSIGGDTAELRILIWISNVYGVSAFKNNLFRSLISRFAAEKIVLK